jgi:hypothetical protein
MEYIIEFTLLHLSLCLLFNIKIGLNMMQMNSQWMNADRRSRSTLLACKLFSKWPKPTRTQRDSCVVHALCRNDKDYSDWGTLHLHFIKNGFMTNYVLWTRHGERGVVMEENEDEEDDNNIPDWSRGKILQILYWKMLATKRYRKTAMLMILVKF